MEKYFDSFAIGQLINITKLSNNIYVIDSKEGNYRCEVVLGDEVFILNINGGFTQDMIINIDENNKIITFAKNGSQDLHSLLFIGR